MVPFNQVMADRWWGGRSGRKGSMAEGQGLALLEQPSETELLASGQCLSNITGFNDAQGSNAQPMQAAAD